MAKWQPKSVVPTRGVAKVLKGKDPKGNIAYRIIVEEKRNSETNEVIQAEKKFEVLAENVPDNFGKGYHNVTISSDGNNVLSFFPAVGNYTVRLKEFAAKEGETPSPKTVTDKYGEKQVFTAILEIVDGEYKGVTIPYRLQYNIADSDGVMGYSKRIGRSPNVQALNSFLDCIGAFDYGELPYRENMLPIWMAAANKAKKKFSLYMDNGWPVKVTPLMEDVDLPAWEEEEKESVDDDLSTDDTEDNVFSLLNDDEEVENDGVDFSSDDVWEE